MSKAEADDRLDDLDVARALRKYIALGEFDTYSEASFFARGYLVRAGYDFKMATSMAREVLIKEWK